MSILIKEKINSVEQIKKAFKKYLSQMTDYAFCENENNPYEEIKSWFEYWRKDKQILIDFDIVDNNNSWYYELYEIWLSEEKQRNKNYKNLIIEKIPSIEKKKVLYEGLSSDQKLYYTTNARSVPNYNNVYMGENIKIVLNPIKKQQEYFDKKLYKVNYLKEVIYQRGLRNKIDIDNQKHLKRAQQLINYQYSIEDVKHFLKKII